MYLVSCLISHVMLFSMLSQWFYLSTAGREGSHPILAGAVLICSVPPSGNR